jgi:hypothetical protein
MNGFTLYSRMREHGTLAENASDVPDARFALPSTINWMHALAILVDVLALDFKAGRTFYAKVQRRALSEREINSICEQLLFSLHQIASLKAMADAKNKAANGLAMPPFADRLSALVADTVERELAPARIRGKHPLTSPPTTAEQAWGCCAEYLSGTADWEQWNIRERVVQSREFKNLGVDSFRTAAARKLRDAWYQKRGIAFLHQASRYRGKANYRDAIYLAYGKSVPKLLEGFIDDLAEVLTAFSAMAAAYASMRMGRELWSAFIDDLEAKRSISLSPKAVWS